MAMFKFVDDVTEELLQCPICREAYRTPKMLSCQHTFCEHCLRRWELETRVGVGGRRQQLRCPVCRAAVPGGSDVAESLPVNTTLVALQRRIDELVSASVETDETDEEQQRRQQRRRERDERCRFIQRLRCICYDCRSSVSFCYDCSTFFCDVCDVDASRQHRTHPQFRPDASAGGTSSTNSTYSSCSSFCSESSFLALVPRPGRMAEPDAIYVTRSSRFFTAAIALLVKCRIDVDVDRWRRTADRFLCYVHPLVCLAVLFIVVACLDTTRMTVVKWFLETGNGLMFVVGTLAGLCSVSAVIFVGFYLCHVSAAASREAYVRLRITDDVWSKWRRRVRNYCLYGRSRRRFTGYPLPPVDVIPTWPPPDYHSRF